MNQDDCITDLTEAIYKALLRDLPKIEYSKFGGVTAKRDHGLRDVDVTHFAQVWGSTALGFGGIGGQAITTAYTTVVLSMKNDLACVYFGGGLAYIVKNGAALSECLGGRDFPGLQNLRRCFADDEVVYGIRE